MGVLPTSKPKRPAGFTLIELLVSISIIAILSSIGLVTYSSSQKAARDQRRKQDLEQIKAALIIYKQAHRNETPDVPGGADESDNSTWDKLRDGDTPPLPDPPYDGLVPNFLSQLPKDPINNSIYKYYYHSGKVCAELETTTSGNCDIGGAYNYEVDSNKN